MEGTLYDSVVKSVQKRDINILVSWLDAWLDDQCDDIRCDINIENVDFHEGWEEMLKYIIQVEHECEENNIPEAKRRELVGDIKEELFTHFSDALCHHLSRLQRGVRNGLRRGWYRVTLEIHCSDLNRGGTRDVTYSGDCLADNARQAYENIDGTGRASIEAYLQERDLSMYGHDNYNDTDIEFLGMRVDPDEEHPDGYSRKAWERYIVDNPDEHM